MPHAGRGGQQSRGGFAAVWAAHSRGRRPPEGEFHSKFLGLFSKLLGGWKWVSHHYENRCVGFSILFCDFPPYSSLEFDHTMSSLKEAPDS